MPWPLSLNLNFLMKYKVFSKTFYAHQTKHYDLKSEKKSSLNLSTKTSKVTTLMSVQNNWALVKLYSPTTLLRKPPSPLTKWGLIGYVTLHNSFAALADVESSVHNMTNVSTFDFISRNNFFKTEEFITLNNKIRFCVLSQESTC